MNNWFGRGLYPLTASSEDPVEALQTDVMRFMAILGLCLMAIFSIVQSISYQPPVTTPQATNQDILAENIDLLKNQVDQLTAQITAVTSELNEKKRELDSQQRAAEQQLERSQRQLATLQQQNDSQRERLDQLSEQIANNEKSLQQAQQQLTREQKLYQHHRQQVEQIKPSASNQNQAAQQPASASSEEKTGFSLRFASEQALLSLIENQQIGLYVLAGKQSWTLTGHAGHWQAQSAPAPRQYYEMAATTVPSALKRQLYRQLAGSQQQSLVWAVKLPASISHQLQQLMQGFKSGDLIIDEQGHVDIAR